MKNKELKIIGTMGLCNWGGLVLLEDINSRWNEDSIISAFDYGDGLKHIRKTKVHYTNNFQRMFIIRGKTRYYFDNIMRSDSQEIIKI